jgi:hypothetical protein
MTLPTASPKEKILVLGTALWGWGVDRTTAYKLLDQFVSLGGIVIDTATNYPINKRPEDYGLALNWIAEWLAFTGKVDVSVIAKIGAIDNLGGPTTNLTPSFILKSEEFLRDRLGSALAAIAVHWDNRGDNDVDTVAIVETINEFARISASGLSISFSGVRHPQTYLEAAPELANKWWIQVKENALSDSARQHYTRVFPNASYLAYGINMGGIKLESPSNHSSISLRGVAHPSGLVERLSSYLSSKHGLRPSPTNLNELALITSFLNPALSGVIVGPRDVAQLLSTQSFWSRLKNECSADMAARLPSLIELYL